MGGPSAVSWIVKNILIGIAAALCMLFVIFWFILPDPAGKGVDYPIKYPERIEDDIKSRFFRTDGYYGSVLIFQTLPFVVIAMIGYAVVFLRKRLEEAGAVPDRSSKLSISVLSFPLWVKSPLGVLTVGNVLFLVSLLFIMMYSLGRTLDVNFAYTRRAWTREDYGASLTTSLWGNAGYYIGRVANLPFALLWIPVSRGSPFLRLIKLPYEQAVKYHIWLGAITMFFLTVHSVAYIVYYVAAHIPEDIVSWDIPGEYPSIVAGVVAWGAGLAMWVTSLNYFRRRWYEVFFAVHHLYIVFLLMWIYHVLWTVHFFSIPVILFIVDRFLRFLQSRQSVTLLSARVLDSGAMELTFPRNHFNRRGRLQPVYEALSSWYLKFPGLPKMMGHQWHALSVMSTPKDGKPEVSIVIKPLGGWTNNLLKELKTQEKFGCPFKFKAGVEGPYGDESDFYLKYEYLVLVAGGIGLTPLAAVLRDILHRYRLQKERGGNHNLPTSIELYHCVRTTEELCVLNSVNPHEILPDYNNLGLDITVHAYVTPPAPGDVRKAVPLHEIAKGEDIYNLSSFKLQPKQGTQQVYLEAADNSVIEGISPVSPTGETAWVGAVALASIVGFYVLYGLSNVFWIKSYDDKFPNYSRAHLLVGCMLLGVGVFGGAMILLWYYRSALNRWRFGAGAKVSKLSNPSSPDHEIPPLDEEGAAGAGSPWSGTLQFGRRPLWDDVFGNLAARHEGKKVGVLVSGAPGMVEDVAIQCKRYTPVNMKTLFGTGQTHGVVFDFHSVSFEL